MGDSTLDQTIKDIFADLERDGRINLHRHPIRIEAVDGVIVLAGLVAGFMSAVIPTASEFGQASASATELAVIRESEAAEVVAKVAVEALHRHEHHDGEKREAVESKAQEVKEGGESKEI